MDRAAHEAGIFQHLHVLGRCRKRHAEGRGEIAHIAFAAGEIAQHRPPRGIGKGMENGIEGRVLFNHVVEYSRVVLKFNHLVELFFGPPERIICRVPERAAWCIPIGGPKMRFLAAAAMVFGLSTHAFAQSAIPALPKEMIGTWGFEDAESCDSKNSDFRMTASARNVEFHASSYALKKIWRQANGKVKATATTSEEGEAGKRRGAMELKLVSPDKISVTTRGDEPMIYVRCKPRGKAG